MKKFILFLAIMLLCSPVFSQQKDSNFEEVITDTIDGVIVPQDRARDFPITVPNPQEFFTPSKNDILKAEGKLFDFVEKASSEKEWYTDKPDLSKKLSNYKRQYAGIIENGKRKIWFNLLSMSKDTENWKSGPVLSVSGFTVWYDIDSSTFNRLSGCNLGKRKEASEQQEALGKADVAINFEGRDRIFFDKPLIYTEEPLSLAKDFEIALKGLKAEKNIVVVTMGKGWSLKSEEERNLDLNELESILNGNGFKTILFVQGQNDLGPIQILRKVEREKQALAKEELLRIAVNKAKALRYNTEEMNIIYDEGNVKLKEHCKRLGVSVYDEKTKQWEKVESSTPEKDFPVLAGRNYQAIYFGPKNQQKGGDLWVFVDIDTGEIIKWVGGK